MTDTESLAAGRWRDLLGPRHLGASTVLAGGVALYATNGFLTISLLPSAVAEIGGQRFYAWVTTVYLVGAVVAATTVYALLQRMGPRWSYVVGLGVFGIGSLGCVSCKLCLGVVKRKTTKSRKAGPSRHKHFLLVVLQQYRSERSCRHRIVRSIPRCAVPLARLDL